MSFDAVPRGLPRSADQLVLVKKRAAETCSGSALLAMELQYPTHAGSDYNNPEARAFATLLRRRPAGPRYAGEGQCAWRSARRNAEALEL